MKLKRELDVKLPSRPNFIEVGGVSTSIADFTSEELRAIGTAWTMELIDLADRKRNEPSVAVMPTSTLFRAFQKSGLLRQWDGKQGFMRKVTR
jgi:hypothetical protein